jgi:hypothetical protein
MPRTIALFLFLASLAPLAVLGQEVGLLGEVVPWPIPCADISMHPLMLHDHPLEPLESAPTLSGSRGYYYGILPLGSGSDPGITVVVSQHGEPWIIVDVNNDEDLANDNRAGDRERIDARTYRWQVTVDVEYNEKGTVSRLPYHVLILASFSYATEQYEYWYSCFCHRRGLVDLGNTLYPVAITDLSSTARYDDLSNIFLSIDTDGDGELDMRPESHEVYRPKEPFQVQVQDVVYAITSVSEDGCRISLERVGNAEMRSIISVGHTAPDFSTTTLDGHDIRLSDFRGKVVVLVFCPVFKTTDCPMCDTASPSSIPRISSRMSDIRDAISLFRDGIVMLTVYTGSNPLDTDQTTSSKLSTEIELYDPRITESYRRSNGLLIIDQMGVIAGMDEAWYTIWCGVPRGGYHHLTLPEIDDILTNLLEATLIPQGQ